MSLIKFQNYLNFVLLITTYDIFNAETQTTNTESRYNKEGMFFKDDIYGF